MTSKAGLVLEPVSRIVTAKVLVLLTDSSPEMVSIGSFFSTMSLIILDLDLRFDVSTYRVDRMGGIARLFGIAEIIRCDDGRSLNNLYLRLSRKAA